MAVYLDVDISHLQALIEKMRIVHTRKEFELLMYRAFRRTGQRVRNILKAEIPKDYQAKPTWIGENVGSPRMQFGGFGNAVVSCSIPINGARGVLGSKFHAAGPRGRRSKTARAYMITAQIVRAKATVLPTKMPDNPYGGNPPFLTGGGKIQKGIVFTRKTEARLPIIRVPGIGVPQMPMNRSQDSVQDEIVETLKKRIEHEHQRLIDRCR